jgi:hypothetical protein
MGVGRASKTVKRDSYDNKGACTGAGKNEVNMAVRFHRFVTFGLAALSVSGCSMNLFGRNEPAYSPPAPVAAAPAGTVTGTTLPPPDGSVTGTLPSGLASLDPSADAGTAASPPAGSTEIGRTDLLGGWKINAAGESCQLFMTLTTWAGGYRASTRGCGNATFQGISAWNIEGGQVQLLNDAGTTVARLYASSRTELNGQTPGGGPVTVTR